MAKSGLMAKPRGIGLAALAALLAVVALVAFTACSSASDERAGEGGAPEARPAGDESSAASDTTAGGPGLPLPQVAQRKIVRTATLKLTVENAREAVARIDQIATEADGFVSNSNVSVEEGSGGDGESSGRAQTGVVTIRVPAAAFSGVMAQLRGIAKDVTSETIEASEVTDEFTDLQARLRNLQATEASYLKLLEQAGAIPDILAVQERLNETRLEVEQVQGRINVINDLSDFATITIELTLPGGAGDEGWVEQVWEASWAVAWAVVVALAAVAIFGAVSLLWLVPLIVIASVVWRLFGRRLADWAVRLYRL